MPLTTVIDDSRQEQLGDTIPTVIPSKFWAIGIDAPFSSSNAMFGRRSALNLERSKFFN